MKTQNTLARRLLMLASLLLVCIVLFASCNSGDSQPTEPPTPTETSKLTDESNPTGESKPTDKGTDDGNDPTEPHVHAWSEWAVTTAPTCTEKGEESRSCSCGEVEKKAVEATGHAFGEWETTTKATCTANGEQKRECACGEVETKSIPATGHSYDTVVTNPTCTERGYTTYTCACGDSYIDNYVSATGHTFGDWATINEPTCTKAGAKQRVCACGYKENKTVSATGHSFGAWTVTKATTCTTDGHEERTCETCGTIESHDTIAPGHSFSEWTATKEPTRTEDGEGIRDCSVCFKTEKKILRATGSVGLKYTKNSDENSYYVSGIGTCTDIDIIIPSYYDDLPVTSIGDGAFKNCRNFLRITIPESVTSIASNSFDGCTSLLTVYNNSNMIITPGSSESGFVVYNAYKVINKDGTVVYDDSFTIINDFVFKPAIGRDKHRLIAYVGDEDTITLPDDFNGEPYILSDFKGGVNVTLSKVLSSSLGESSFHRGSYLKSITIPEGFTNIRDYTFRKCTSLKSVTLPSSLVEIGDAAFYNCTSLTSINIPNRVEVIDWHAFYGCTALTSINIPNSVLTVGSYAFYDCSGLKSIIIGENASIGAHAFYNCSSSLENIEVRYNRKYYSQNNCLIDKEMNELILGCKNSVIPNTVAYIGQNSFRNCTGLTRITIPQGAKIKDGAFYGCSSLTSIVIPDGQTGIGRNTFENCSSLKNVTIPDSVTYIDDYAFYGCTSLSITLPNKVKQIGRYALSGCTLTSITIPDSLTEIEYGAFLGCNSTHTSIVAGSNNPKYYSKNNCLIEKGTNALILGCNNSIIPDGVTSIGANAFYGCSFTSITIPYSVISIEDSAFYGCDNLTRIKFKGTIKEWNAITIDVFWKSGVPATEVICTDGVVKL